MKYRASLLLAALVCAVLCTVGCGKPQVSGTVYYSDGQTPLKAGVVNFVNDQYLCKGDIDKDTGKFKMRTVKPGDGVPPGTYKVYLTGTLDLVSSGRESKTSDVSFETVGQARSTIATKYLNPDESGLTVTVKSSMTYDITLEDEAPAASSEE